MPSRVASPFTTANSFLPSNDIRALLPGPEQGELWIAAIDGLARLDYGGTPLDHADDQWWLWSKELPGKDVLSLAKGREGELWVGTAAGLAQYDGSVWHTYTEGPAGGAIDDLALSPSGRYLWVAMAGGGASRYDILADRWARFNVLGGALRDDDVHVMLASHENIAWLGTSGGLSGVEQVWEANWSVVPPVPGRLASNQITSGWVDPERGTVWVGTGHGVSRSDDGGATWQTFTIDHGLPSNTIHAVWTNGRGIVWAGTSHGLSRSDDGGATWQTFSTEQGLGSDFGTAVWGDERGTVWAGTDRGLSRSDDGGATWQTFSAEQGLGSDVVTAVWGNGYGTVWAGGVEGLSRSDDGGLPGEPFPSITDREALSFGRYGRMGGARSGWAQKMGSATATMGGATWRTFTTEQGLNSNAITTVWGEGEHTVWVGTPGGLNRSDDSGATWETFDVQGLEGESIRAVWGDGSGTVWVGTPSRLSRSSDGGATWQALAAERGLGSNIVTAVWGGGRGSVWVGTEGGLGRSDDRGTTWRTLTMDQEPGNNDVRAVWGDGQGTLWVGTYGGGVSRLAAAAGPPPRAHWAIPERPLQWEDGGSVEI